MFKNDDLNWRSLGKTTYIMVVLVVAILTLPIITLPNQLSLSLLHPAAGGRLTSSPVQDTFQEKAAR